MLSLKYNLIFILLSCALTCWVIYTFNLTNIDKNNCLIKCTYSTVMQKLLEAS